MDEEQQQQERGAGQDDEQRDVLRAERKAAERALHARRVETAKLIAEQLGESAEEPTAQIYRAVKKLGIGQALDFLRQTHEFEGQGGRMVTDGSRRRTPGGVFFLLIKERVPVETTKHIFKKRSLYQQAAQKKKAAAQVESQESRAPAAAPMTWADRLAVLTELNAEKGQVTTVKITLIGRPGRIVERGACIVTSMESTKIPALPKGLPTPPQASTSYTVYVAVKQWRKVADAIKDQDDVLIVEGYPHLDAEAKTVAVFATNTTTKNLQAAQRQTRKPS
jgi:Phosphorylated adapter RNA export protein, RNA-binding domain